MNLHWLFIACADPAADPPVDGPLGLPDPLVVPEDNISRVLGDCAGTRREPEAYANLLFEGDDLQRYTLEDPEAVCNDGTRAVIYVRPARSQLLQDVWSVHLQGGGACDSWTECAVRYCGYAYYDAAKMSSAWTPLETGAEGLMAAEPANHLAGANQVYFYYCSSDTWVGRGSRRLEPEDAAFSTFTMFERGDTILRAGLRELEAGIVAEGGWEMPRPSAAKLVVLSGSSAGSSGLMLQADALAESLSSSGARVELLLDAGHAPPLDLLDEATRPAAEALYQEAWEARVHGRDVEPAGDTSCAEVYGGGVEAWRCGELAGVLREHVLTPYFVRQDLRDLSVLSSLPGLSADTHEQLAYEGLVGLADAPGPVRRPGVFGPNCQEHVGLGSMVGWRVASVGADGSARTFQDSFLAWSEGSDVMVLDLPVVGEGPGPTSYCGAAAD